MNADKANEVRNDKKGSWHLLLNLEAEYRFLIKDERDLLKGYKIGEITAVYFGNPYGNIVNPEKFKESSRSIQCYEYLKNQLIAGVRGKNIKCFFVEIDENGEIKEGREILNSQISSE